MVFKVTQRGVKTDSRLPISCSRQWCATYVPDLLATICGDALCY